MLYQALGACRDTNGPDAALVELGSAERFRASGPEPRVAKPFIIWTAKTHHKWMD